ncbi:hypothetical protein MW887_008918 [Aspergillus wentii]|nr:hypothetical protein MW887_008918 [Aspergillus wentii]
MSPSVSVRDSHSQYWNAHDNDSDDVPVNKKTSFNGKLSKYLHLSDNNAATTETTPDSTSESTTSDRPKRKSRLESEDTTTSAPDVLSPSKRRKAPTPTIPRITRSRSTTALSSPRSKSTPQSRRKTNKSPEFQTQTQTTSSSTSLLRDTIPPNLTLLLVGVNPGILTGTTGYAYAHPSNLFWKLLHSSGLTTIRHPPSDTYRLPELYNIGNTNIVERPTRDASMLSKAEMDAGVPILEAKIAAQRPEAVCLVGKSIWEAVWRARKGRAIRKEEFRYGWQDESENMGKVEGEGEIEGWNGAPVFVATTTSGLAAGMKPAEKEAVWKELGSWVVARRRERGIVCGIAS